MSGRILIVDDVATNRIVYRARLAAAFYEPLLAADGANCLRMAVDAQPDLILLDLSLPDMSGRDVLRQLRQDPRTRDIPIIVLTASPDSDARLGAFSAGADDVILKPASDQVLLARVRNLLRGRADAGYSAAPEFETAFEAAFETGGLAEAPARFEPCATVALVSGQADLARRWQQDLSGQLRDRLVVLSRAEVLAEAPSAPLGGEVPDVFIIHDEGSDTSGSLRLLSELKSRHATRHSAVCVIGAAGDGDDAAMAFDLGADDVVGLKVSAAELALRTRSLLRRKRDGDRHRARIEDGLRLAMVDPLTGLHNRRYALPQLAAIAARAVEIGQDFAVMVVDLDRFKTVNDKHGHAAGDAVLVEVARRLRANLRDGDLLARIGGEEFLVVVPDSSTTGARLVAERLCAALDERPIRLASGASLKVTVSIGVAVSALATGASLSVEALVEQADLALLESKGAGRNQVTYRLSAA
jgi:two-component system cell cycle response regulator